MFEYLNDTAFLEELNKVKLRKHYAKIILLSFDEQPIYEIQGNITAGSLSINGSSAVRRTINLTMLADEQNSNIENVENQISINKKVRIQIGFENTLKDYSHYGDIIWFPCGLFILSSANISRSTSGWNISISGKDKMCLLDGTVGGTFPAPVEFHRYYDEEKQSYEYPTIYTIIQSAVNYYGEEPLNNIIISDIDNTAKLLIRYVGKETIYFNENYSSFQTIYDEEHGYINPCYSDQDIGYQETEFNYPGELTFNAGQTVLNLLDKISKTLGNFEFFYDLDGRFIFREIKNYLNGTGEINLLKAEDYTRIYNSPFVLTDLETTSAINSTPKFDNIKNDFIVWGKKSDNKKSIRYHLAIDTKPDGNLANNYFYEVKDDDGAILRYETSQEELNEPNKTLVSSKTTEWREVLYRQALENKLIAVRGRYDEELLAEWRKIFDPLNESWEGGWNPIVKTRPRDLDYWLDFIDTSSEIGRYSINQIGKRSKVLNTNEIISIYNIDPQDIIFIDTTKYGEAELAGLRNRYSATGQKFFQLTPEYSKQFIASATGASCFDKIRELLYQYLTYNTGISITCLPRYYIEPNTLIYIQDKKSNINANYQITQINLPLTYNGTMTINATEALTRV